MPLPSPAQSSSFVHDLVHLPAIGPCGGQVSGELQSLEDEHASPYVLLALLLQASKRKPSAQKVRVFMRGRYRYARPIRQKGPSATRRELR